MELWTKIWKIGLAVLWALVILIPVIGGFYITALAPAFWKMFLLLICFANLGFNGFGLWKWVKANILPLFKKPELLED